MSSDNISDKVIEANFTDINLSTRISKDILIDKSTQKNTAHAYNQLKNNLNTYLEEVKKIQQEEERDENDVINATLKKLRGIYISQYNIWSKLDKLEKNNKNFEPYYKDINNDTIDDVDDIINNVTKQMISTITEIYDSKGIKVLYFTDVNIRV